MSEIGPVLELMGRASTRVRGQRCLDAGMRGAFWGLALLAVAMIAIQLEVLTPSVFPLLLVAASAGMALAALLALAWPLEPLRLAYRIDRTNSNADRLGSALEFSALGGETTRFMLAQIRDASRRAAGIDLALALPRRLPSSARPLLLALVLVAAASLYEAPPRTRPAAPPPPPRQEQLLALPDLDLQRDAARKMRAEAEALRDAELAELANRFDELVDRMEDRDIDQEQALSELQQLESAAKAPDLDEAVEEIVEKLAEVSGELSASKDTRKLADALQKRELDRARKELERLARLLADEKLSAGQLERLARAFGGLARKLAESLAPKDLEALKEKLAGLRKRVGTRGLSSRERERIKSLEEQVRKAMAQQSKGRKERGQKDPLRALNRLTRRSDEAARKMKEAAQKKRGSRGRQARQKAGGRQQQQAGEQLRKSASSLGEMERAIEQARARRSARASMEQVRELIKRAATSRSGSGQKEERLSDFDRRADPKGASRRAARQRRAKKERGRRDHASGPGGPRRGMKKPKDRGQRQPGRLSRRGKGRGPTAGQGSDGAGQGRATSNLPGHEDQRVRGMCSGSESRTEILWGAAERGFARRGYQEVYGRFEAVAEEEIERAKVPPGFRFYLRRYFELIRPREP